MTPHEDPQGRSGLEEEFFRREDQRLLEQLRTREAAEAAREKLAQATGIKNAVLLEKLRTLNIGPETVAALRLVPLIEVAWADGSIDAKERQAVLGHAREVGLAEGSPELALLDGWLTRRPEPRLVLAWTHLIHGLIADFDADQVKKLKAKLLDPARGVAGASGGVLGVGKISSAETAALKRLEAAFEPAK
jgi:hypothetical protein